MIRATCPECRQQYQLDETKFPKDTVSVTCTSCQSKFTVKRDGGQPSLFGPKGLIVGIDLPGLQDAVRAVGFEPLVQPDPALARDFLLREYPPLVLLSPAQLVPPPLNDYAAILSLASSDRRRSYFVLVADKLRTMDGNAAFLYGVNLVLSTKDLPRFEPIWKEATGHHEILYAAMKVASAPGV